MKNSFLLPLFVLFLHTSGMKAQCPHTHTYVNYTKYFGHSGDDQGWHIIPIDDGDADTIANNGYIAVGSAMMTSGDAFVMRLNTTLDSLWGKTIDGGASTPQADAAYSVVQTKSNLLMICGVTKTKHFGSKYNQNFWVIKMNLNGDTIWKKQYGSDSTDVAYDIKQDHDGNFVVVGTATGANHDLAGDTVDHVGDIWVLKIDTNGSILHQQVFHGSIHGPGHDPDAAHAVVVDCAGKYVLSSSCSTCGQGDTTMQNLLIKLPTDLSSDSSVILGKLLSNSDHPSYNIIQAYNGTFGTCSNNDPYICIGISHTSGGCLLSAHDYWATNNNHDLTDNSIFANCPNDADQGVVHGGTQGDDGWSITQGCDGYYMAGFTKSGNDGYDVNCNNDLTSPYKEDAWIAKISTYDGSLMWAEAFGDTNNDRSYYIRRLYDGSFIFIGYASAPAAPSNKGNDFFIVKFEDTTATCAKPTGLSRTVQAGNCRVIFSWTSLPCVPGYILKYKTSGSAWTTVDPAPNPDTISFAGGTYVWTLQAKCSQHKSSDTTRGVPFQLPPGCLRIGEPNNESYNSLSVYPNPSDGSFEISLQLIAENDGLVNVEILDLTGEVVSSSREIVENGILEKQFSFRNLPSGFYWLRVIDGGRTLTTKLVLQRN